MAQNKHLHEKLGISFAELGALLGTRTLIERGLLTHLHPFDFFADDRGHYINMGVTCKQNKHCGSVHCIGGTMALLMGMDPHTANDYVAEKEFGSRTKGLSALFYPKDFDYDRITPKQMIAAIDNYLKDGKPRWDTILAK